MEKMVWATAVETSDTSKSPRKLNTAAMMMACRGFMARVETAVAMALGASVQPFTSTTPSVSATVTARTGFAASCARNSLREIVKQSPRFLFTKNLLYLYKYNGSS